MKKLLILFLVLALLAIAITPALAAGGPPPSGSPRGSQGCGANAGSSTGSGCSGQGTFSLAGKITAVDGAALTVQVVSGNTLVKSYLGQALTVQTTSATRFLQRSASGVATPITFDQLAAGQTASIRGSLANGVFTAQRVTVGAQQVHQP